MYLHRFIIMHNPITALYCPTTAPTTDLENRELEIGRFAPLCFYSKATKLLEPIRVINFKGLSTFLETAELQEGAN